MKNYFYFNLMPYFMAIFWFCHPGNVGDKQVSISPYQEYGVICIENRMNYAVVYSYRWGNDAWKSNMIEPYATARHWWIYELGNQRSPNFEISFDSDFGDFNYHKLYSLERYRSFSTDCSGAKKYYFSWTYGDFFELYSIE